jgi:hypothetical protein
MNSKCVWICVWNAFGCLFFWTLVLPSWSSLYPFGWMFFLIIKFGRVSFPCWGWELLFSLFTHVWYKMFSTNSANFSIFWEFLGQFFNITKLKEKKPDYIGHKNYWNKLILKYKYTMFVTKCWKEFLTLKEIKNKISGRKPPPKINLTMKEIIHSCFGKKRVEIIWQLKKKSPCWTQNMETIL